MRFIKSIIYGLLLLFSLASSPSHAASLIRDAEIEGDLRLFATPVFEAAGIVPSAVKIFIINDPTINAFVAGGSNLFIHTGLLLATDSPAMLIGVMAHETGHIAGGHLARGAEKLQNAQLGTVLSYILGAAVIATGAADAGTAIISGSQQVLMRNYLAFSRTNEQSADQAALTYLDSLSISASGMLRLFEILRRNENRLYGKPDPYALTHPLSKERIAHLRNHVDHSTIPVDAVPKGYAEKHARIIGKLYGYLQSPENTFRKYPAKDKSVAARYARAVAWYKQPNLTNALQEIDSLIKESPNDPFFHEMKGQILFENSKVEEALQSYRLADKLRPDSALIKGDLAKVELARGTKEDIESAVLHLRKSTELDNSNASIWRLLATAYGKKGDIGLSYLALAEEAMLQDNFKLVLQQSDLAIKALPNGSPSWLRASDLRRLAQKRQDDK